MAETPTSDPPTPAPAPVPVRRREWMAPLALFLGVLAFAGGSALFWFMQMRTQELEVQLARRIGEFDTSAREARIAAKEVHANVDGALGRIAGLEGKALEAQNQQLALEAMYQELARSHDERLLADIEQTLLLVEQQLQLAGNVRAAVLGLEALEARLARMEKPQFAALREAIAADAARLKVLPGADLSAVNSRIDVLLAGIDRLKLETEPETVKVSAPAPAPPPPTDALAWIRNFGRDAWAEIRQLVRIRHLDHPDLALLTPPQTYFLRQNLRLRLLSARLAALQRDEVTYLGDLAAARAWIVDYFSPRDPFTVTMLEDIVTLETTPVVLKDADVGASLKAVRAAAGKKD